jgi:hypothetical protein
MATDRVISVPGVPPEVAIIVAPVRLAGAARIVEVVIARPVAVIERAVIVVIVAVIRDGDADPTRGRRAVSGGAPREQSCKTQRSHDPLHYDVLRDSNYLF